MRTIIEGFAVETTDDLIFTVKGLLHPPARVIAYLRYLPHPAGERARGSVRYRRVYRFEQQEAILEARYPTYLAHDAVLGLRVQSVPRGRVRRVYDPRQYLAALRQRGPDDPLEQEALSLSSLLCESTRVAPESLGVSGSLMLGLHRPDSDLDLIVYGEQAAREVHGTVRDLLHEADSSLRRPTQEQLAALHAQHRPDTPLSFQAFAQLQSRKVNELRFRGRETFIRFVKHPEEVAERYGDRRFEGLGPAKISARVTDDSEAIFTPCRYVVEDARLGDGSPVTDLRKIVSYRGRFSDQIRAGEWTLARGELERVTDVTEEGRLSYRRLVVGGRAGDTLLARQGRHELP
ncbi:MAG: nucleotidyltransferase domain-containing protein [Chloroflexota bacterium]|nr:nucleotidyltransferase domain-containing protein [Chloroflexota bacterium]